MYKEYLQKLENLKGAERIDLGLADDLNKMISKMIPLQKKAQTFISKIESQGGQLQKTINALKGTLKQALKIQQDGYDYLDPAKKMLEKIEASAKELGIDPNDIKGYKEAKKVRGDAYYDYKGLADAYWENVHGLGDDVNALKSIAPL